MNSQLYRLGHKYRDLTKRVPADEFTVPEIQGCANAIRTGSLTVFPLEHPCACSSAFVRPSLQVLCVALWTYLSIEPCHH
jgi:hypothetical protein